MRNSLLGLIDAPGTQCAGGSVGPPPPVNLGYNPPLVWNQRMFFLLNNYHASLPHSYNIPDQYFRSEACASTLPILPPVSGTSS